MSISENFHQCMADKRCKQVSIGVFVVLLIILIMLVIVLVFRCSRKTAGIFRRDKKHYDKGFAPIPDPQFTRQAAPIYVPPAYMPSAYETENPFDDKNAVDYRQSSNQELEAATRIGGNFTNGKKKNRFGFSV